MSVTPPPDFWPQPFTIKINGVLTASDPLAVSSGNMTINDASATDRGVVSTGAQVFAGAKNFMDGLTVNSGTLVTALSTDGTLATPTDHQLPTALAVKTYVDNTCAESASPPVYITAGDIGLQNDATAAVTTISTDGTFALAADTQLVTALAVKTYVDNSAMSADPPIYNTAGVLGLKNTLSDAVTAISPNTALSPGDDATLPTQGAVGAYTSSYVTYHSVTGATAPLYVAPPSPIQIHNNNGATVTTVSTDNTLAANSDLYIATQKATKGYVDNLVTVRGATSPLTVVSTAVQINNSAAARITEVSIDGTLADNSDTKIATQKAVKTYCSSLPGGYITSVSTPLSVASGNLSIAAAGASSSGIVTTGTQTIAGAKTLSGVTHVSNTTAGSSSVTGALTVAGTIGGSTGAWLGADLRMDIDPINGPAMIYSTVDGNELVLTAQGHGPQVEIQSLSYGGNLVVWSAPTSDKEIDFVDGGTSQILVGIAPTVVNYAIPISIYIPAMHATSSVKGAKAVSTVLKSSRGNHRVVKRHLTRPRAPMIFPGTPMITMQTDLGIAVMGITDSSGSLIVTTGGSGMIIQDDTDVQLHSTTNATDLSSGALHTAGGISVAQDVRIGGDLFAQTATLVPDPSGPAGQVLIMNNSTNSASLYVLPTNVLNVAAAGGLTVNGSSVPTISNTSVNHILLGAANGFTCWVYYQKVGKVVTASFAGLDVASQAHATIYLNASTLIPAGYRPVLVESNEQMVIHHQTDMNDRGSYEVSDVGQFTVYSDVNGGLFGGASTHVGWYPFTISWRCS
jgi:hypothetical protein